MVKKIHNKEQKKIINKIINMYPDLKSDKKKIMKEFFDSDSSSSEDNVNKNCKQELMFDVIKIDNQDYYLDSNNRIWDRQAEIVGMYDKIKDDYMLFNNMDDSDDENHQDGYSINDPIPEK